MTQNNNATTSGGTRNGGVGTGEIADADGEITRGEKATDDRNHGAGGNTADPILGQIGLSSSPNATNEAPPTNGNFTDVGGWAGPVGNTRNTDNPHAPSSTGGLDTRDPQLTTTSPGGDANTSNPPSAGTIGGRGDEIVAGTGGNASSGDSAIGPFSSAGTRGGDGSLTGTAGTRSGGNSARVQSNLPSLTNRWFNASVPGLAGFAANLPSAGAGPTNHLTTDPAHTQESQIHSNTIQRGGTFPPPRPHEAAPTTGINAIPPNRQLNDQCPTNTERLFVRLPPGRQSSPATINNSTRSQEKRNDGTYNGGDGEEFEGTRKGEKRKASELEMDVEPRGGEDDADYEAVDEESDSYVDPPPKKKPRKSRSRVRDNSSVEGDDSTYYDYDSDGKSRYAGNEFHKSPYISTPNDTNPCAECFKSKNRCHTFLYRRKLMCRRCSRLRQKCSRVRESALAKSEPTVNEPKALKGKKPLDVARERKAEKEKKKKKKSTSTLAKGDSLCLNFSI